MINVVHFTSMSDEQTTGQRRQILDFERTPRAEILAMLLEAADVARKEPSPHRRAKALALIARTLMRLYPADTLQASARAARGLA